MPFVEIGKRYNVNLIIFALYKLKGIQPVAQAVNPIRKGKASIPLLCQHKRRCRLFHLLGKS